MAKKKAEPKQADKPTNGIDWELAEKKLNEAVKRRNQDGHYYNTVVAPLLESFNAGGRNPQLYEAMIQL